MLSHYIHVCFSSEIKLVDLQWCGISHFNFLSLHNLEKTLKAGNIKPILTSFPYASAGRDSACAAAEAPSTPCEPGRDIDTTGTTNITLNFTYLTKSSILYILFVQIENTSLI